MLAKYNTDVLPAWAQPPRNRPSHQRLREHSHTYVFLHDNSPTYRVGKTTHFELTRRPGPCFVSQHWFRKQ